jgi:hypothetical protein
MIGGQNRSRFLFAQHFGNNEYYHCAAKASSEKKVDQRVPGGGNDWGERCNYHVISPPLWSLSLNHGNPATLESYGVFALFWTPIKDYPTNPNGSR